MSAPAVVLNSRPAAVATPLRVLHAWHLLSLDAPTVAFCWMLLFAHAERVAHALPAAAALACAVWLVYAADRLLDARHESAAKWAGAPQATLSRVYRVYVREFLSAGAAVSVLTASMLSVLPRALVEAWLLLAAPLAAYAAAVHLLHLPARWKAVCVGLFFAVAVALPAVVQSGMGWPLASAALAFGGVCRANCAVLRAPARRLRIVLAFGAGMAVVPFAWAHTRTLAPACLMALILLWLLVQKRERTCARLGWLTWRALVDAALVAPALVTLCVGVLLAR